MTLKSDCDFPDYSEILLVPGLLIQYMVDAPQSLC